MIRLHVVADAAHGPPRFGSVNDEQDDAQDSQGEQRCPEHQGGEHEAGNLVDLVEHVGGFEPLGPAAENHEAEVLQQKRDPDGRDQCRDTGGVADGQVGALVHQHSQGGREQQGNGKGSPPGQAEHEDAEVGEVAPHHHDVAVGEVDEPDDPVDHGIADGDEPVEATQCHPVDHLLEEERQFQETFP